jgi:hypothetical protein
VQVAQDFMHGSSILLQAQDAGNADSYSAGSIKAAIEPAERGSLQSAP